MKRLAGPSGSIVGARTEKSRPELIRGLYAAKIEEERDVFPPRIEPTPMYEVTVESDFSSGHYLRNYKGKCENPHGHNYKVRVTLAGSALDGAGLLLDFKLLKQVLRPVIERIDHQMLNDLEPFTVLNPSAENLARYFYDETNQQLEGMTGGRVRVKDCTIWETDTTTATYYE
jgi:6-pyruvoyltetrahydropterin/6-carboxytetrahydropterin synthase